VIPDESDSVDSFTKVFDMLQEQMKSILSSPIDQSDIKPFKDVKKLYAACMNTEMIEKRGLEPFKKILESMGGWPMVQGDIWNESQWSWQKAEVIGRENGFWPHHFAYFQMSEDGIEVNCKYLFFIPQELVINSIS
jgi:neprilysin